MARKPKKKPKLHPVTAYATDITTGQIPANKWVTLACKRHLQDLKTGKKRGIYFDEAAADHAISFFPEFLSFYEGAFSDQPFYLTPCQQFIVGSIFGWKNKADGFRRFRTAYIEMAKGQGKALAIDTPIPIPTGWTTMGDLKTGDRVFDDAGNICNVTASTEIMTGHDCFQVQFSGGGAIVADAEHQWKTNQLYSGNKRGDLIRGIPKTQWTKKPKSGIVGLRTTREISETVAARPTKSLHPQAKWNHRIDVAGALRLPETKLPIKPYTLGAWLGDGDSDAARITGNDYEIINEIEKDGYLVGKKQFKTKETTVFREAIGILPTDECLCGHLRADHANGSHCRACERERDHLSRNGNPRTPRKHYSLNEILRENNLLGNKHIPPEYLRASKEQRFSLLQGIMDTDGHISKNNQCEITLCNKRLATDIVELLRTLGFKLTVNEGDAKLNGIVVNRRWRIRFYACQGEQIARLKRKTTRLPEKPKTRRLSSGRMIVACDPIESVPVRCISVNSPSQMYLAGREMIPTHNSPLAGGIGLYCLSFDDEPGAEIYAAAVTREQAGILFRDAVTFAEKSEALREFLTIHKHNITYESENSFFRAISSEKRGLDGKRPHVALIDEIHEHPDDIVVRKMSAGTKTRRQALTFEITNSGYDRHSICFQHHEYTEKILEGIIDDAAWFGLMTGLDVCEKCAAEGKTIPQDGCPDCDDWRNPDTWEKANPNMRYLGQPFVDYLKRQVEQGISMPSQENIVKRLNFCIWTESITKWIPTDKWNACAFAVDPEALKGRTCYGGLDLSSNQDLTAWVLVFPPEEESGKYEVLCRFFLPEDNMRERVARDKVPYDVWVRKGHIITTPGDLIDYSFILAQIKQDAEYFNIAELAFDRWGSQKITTDLQGIGFEIKTEAGKAQSTGKTLIQFGQGYASMNAPTKEVETMVLGKTMAHGGNPVLSWMVSNVAIKMDPAGNKKPDKDKSTERIDGAVALIMAIGRAMLKAGPVKSVYEERGLITL